MAILDRELRAATCGRLDNPKYAMSLVANARQDTFGVISDVRKAPGHPPSVIALARARTRTSISPGNFDATPMAT